MNLVAWKSRLDEKSADASWRKTAADRSELTEYLTTNAPSLQQFFPYIAMLGHRVGLRKNGLTNQVQALDRDFTAEEHQVLKVLERYNLVSVREGSIRFESFDGAVYIRSAWLEEYAWNVTSSLHLHDLKAGVKVIWQKPIAAPELVQNDNEFDLLAEHNNRMLVVECKARGEVTQHMLHTLETLSRHAGGLFSTPVFITTNNVTEPFRNRAERQGVYIFGCAQLGNFRDFVIRWKNGDIARIL